MIVDFLIEFVKYLTLAVIQGVTEIFPVSSSGHLVIYGHLLQQDFSYNLIIFLHLGTFLAIAFFYRRDLFQILTGKCGGKLPIFMGLSFVMTSITGLVVVRTLGERLASQPENVAALWILNGLLVGIGGKFIPKGKRVIVDLSLLDFILIGIIQGISPFPGISRLGITLIVGLLLGMTWFEALKLSMLLSLPVILFANLYQLLDQIGLLTLPFGDFSAVVANLSGFGDLSIYQWLLYLMALSVSCTIGVLSLRVLSRYLNRPLLIYFGIYSIYAGTFFLSYLALLSV